MTRLARHWRKLRTCHRLDQSPDSQFDRRLHHYPFQTFAGCARAGLSLALRCGSESDRFHLVEMGEKNVLNCMKKKNFRLSIFFFIPLT